MASIYVKSYEREKEKKKKKEKNMITIELFKLDEFT